MKNWFSIFEESLDGSTAPSDLIGAGTADAGRAIAHYRYQHETKLKEAVEDTFPTLLKFLGDTWNDIWNSFQAQNEVSVRSLDWFPEVFLNYYMKTTQPLWLKELARFEHVLDVHQWNHPALKLKKELVLSEDSCIHLGKYEVITFAAPVVQLYEDEEIIDHKKSVKLVIWQKEDGTYYRSLEEWEFIALSKLHMGVETALEDAPEDAEKVGAFFQWLGSSCLIQRLSKA